MEEDTMTEQPVQPDGAPPPAPAWQPPEPLAGPAPGYEFAEFGPRLLAYVIDGLIITAAVIVAVLILAIPFAGMIGSGSQSRLTGPVAGFVVLVVLVVAVITLGYFPYFWTRSGSTPGMRMMGLKVVRDVDGGPLSTGQAIIRLIGYWVSSAVLYLGFIWVLIDKRRRGWHDLIAGTVVVKQV
jgi:uncharacterized RDD family membrane protein YckC